MYQARRYVLNESHFLPGASIYADGFRLSVYLFVCLLVKYFFLLHSRY